MPSNSDISVVRPRAAPPTLLIKRWPIWEEPVRCIGLLVAEIAVGFVAARATANPATGVLIFALLFISSWPLWAPVSFELSSKGIIRGVGLRKRRIAWSEFSHYELQPHGVFLRHHSHRSELDVVHGLFLPSQPPHAELLPVLDFYLRPRPVDNLVSTQTLIP